MRCSKPDRQNRQDFRPGLDSVSGAPSVPKASLRRCRRRRVQQHRAMAIRAVSRDRSPRVGWKEVVQSRSACGRQPQSGGGRRCAKLHHSGDLDDNEGGSDIYEHTSRPACRLSGAEGLTIAARARADRQGFLKVPAGAARAASHPQWTVRSMSCTPRRPLRGVPTSRLRDRGRSRAALRSAPHGGDGKPDRRRTT